MNRNYFLDYNNEDSILVDIKNYQPETQNKTKGNKDGSIFKNISSNIYKINEQHDNLYKDNNTYSNYSIEEMSQKQISEGISDTFINKKKNLNEITGERAEILKEQSKAKEKKQAYDFPQMQQLGLLGDYFYITSKLLLPEYQINLANRSTTLKNSKKKKSLKQMRQVPVTETEKKRIQINLIDLENKRKEIEAQLRSNYEQETSWIQRFAAGTATEVLRQLSDPRQWRELALLNYVMTPVGGAVAAKLGLTSGVAKKTVELGAGAVAEMFEEAIDEYVTDKDVDPVNVISAGLTSVAFGLGIRTLRKAVGGTYNFFKGGDISARGKKYAENIQKNNSNIAKTNKELAKSTVENLKPILASLGKPELEKEILKKSITINGKTVIEINEVLKNVFDLVIKSDTNNFKTQDEISEFLSNDTDGFIKLLKEIEGKVELSEEGAENVNFLISALDPDTIKDVDVDMVKFQEETSKAISTEKVPFTSNAEPEKVVKINKKNKLREISRREKEVKITHNKNDFPKDTLKQQLIQDKVIPDGAVIYYVKGYIDKKTGVAHIKAKWAKNGEMFFAVFERKESKYTQSELETTKSSSNNIEVKHETDIEGQSVEKTAQKQQTEKINSESEAEKNTKEEPVVEKTEEEKANEEFDKHYKNLKEMINNPEKTEKVEYKNQTEADQEFDKEYEKLKKERNSPEKIEGEESKKEYTQKEKVSTEEEIVEKRAPENPLEEAVGVIDEDFNKNLNALEVERALQRELELDTESEILTNEMIRKINLNVIEKIGKIISDKTGLKNLDEIINYYKNKYDVDIKFQEVETLKGKGQERLGEVIITNLDTGKEFSIKIPKEFSTEAKIGIFRHELQHILDTIKNPEFESKTTGKVGKGKKTILEALIESQKGHFLDFENNWWEYSYILNYRINNLMSDGKINRESVKILGLDVPEVLDKMDNEVIEEIVKSVENVDDLGKKIEILKKKTSSYFMLKNAIKRVETSRLHTATGVERIKNTLQTLIIFPFKKANEQAYSRLIKAFELKINGNTLDVERVIQMFYGTGTKLEDFLFRETELPEELLEHSAELNRLKTELDTIINEIIDGTDVTKEDIINSAFYSEKAITKAILGEKAKLFEDADGELDLVKLEKSEKSIQDPVTKKSISKALYDVREIFAEKFFDFFNTDLERLDVLLKNKEVYGKEIAETLAGVKKIVTPEEFDKIIKDNNLAEIEDVAKFLEAERLKSVKRSEALQKNIDKLDSHISDKKNNTKEIIKILKRLRKYYMTPDEVISLAKEKGITDLEEVTKLFNDENFKKIVEINLDKNIKESRKRNAKLFFTGEAESHKGNAKENKNIDSWLHKVSRFQWAKDGGFITQEQLNKFVQENSVLENFGFERLMKDLSASYAIKNVMPAGNVYSISRILGQVENEIISREKKTYTRALEEYIKSEIGEKLGLVTKAPTTILDKVVGRAIKIQNQGSLAGRKALFELIQEPLNMVRGGRMHYGGHGVFGVYKNLIKSILMNVFYGQKIAEMDLATGKRWYNGVALEVQNIVDDLDDVTGYKKIQLKQNGTKMAKLMNAFDTGMNKINFYKYTQALLERASLFESGYILNKIVDLNENGIKNTLSSLVKSDFLDLNIKPYELDLFRKFKETEAFKKFGVFSEHEFYDIITDNDLRQAYEKEYELSQEELQILREALTNKISLLHEKIKYRVSPTEATGKTRYKIETEEDPIRRNVQRVKNNFTSSIQTMWGRMAEEFFYGNIDETTGKFDFSNGVYWKRLTGYALESGLTIGSFALLSDVDFYSDPIGTLEERIDDILEEPSIALEAYLSAQFNPWIVTSGSTVVERPLRFAKYVAKGKYEKAGAEGLKLVFGTVSYNDAKFIYETFEDNF